MHTLYSTYHLFNVHCIQYIYHTCAHFILYISYMYTAYSTYYTCTCIQYISYMYTVYSTYYTCTLYTAHIMHVHFTQYI